MHQILGLSLIAAIICLSGPRLGAEEIEIERLIAESLELDPSNHRYLTDSEVLVIFKEYIRLREKALQFERVIREEDKAERKRLKKEISRLAFTLVAFNQRMVLMFAENYSRSRINHETDKEDVVSELRLHLVSKLHYWDPGKGVKLGTYWYAILKNYRGRLRAFNPVVPTSSRLREFRSREKSIMQEEGHRVSIDRVIGQMSLTATARMNLLQALRPVFSFQEWDGPKKTTSGSELASIHFGDLMTPLEEEEKQVLELLFIEGHSNGGVSEKLGIGLRRVAYVRKCALDKITRYLRWELRLPTHYRESAPTQHFHQNSTPECESSLGLLGSQNS